tara:strand:- start:100 stop:621 length:522 start_codon:yes stop_codon:yes gene_type:complete
MPLQSGSNKLLKAMRRRYDREHYRHKVNLIKSLDPSACIGADVIVGFPGETDDDFLDTYNFIKDLDLAYLHVFSYSERENTDAKNYENSVPKTKRAERSKVLRNLSNKKRQNFQEEYLNRARDVLFESMKGGYAFGYSDNYIQVKVPGSPELINSIYSVNLKKVNGEVVLGEL